MGKKKAEIIDETPAKIVILGMEYCGTCEEQKELLEEELKSGKMKYIDLDSDEGKAWDKKYHPESTPHFLKLNEKTGKYKKVEKFERPDGTYFFK